MLINDNYIYTKKNVIVENVINFSDVIKKSNNIVCELMIIIFILKE